MHSQKITLIGVGLLGGSLGLALRERRIADRVVGFVRRAEAVAECERLGAVDQADADLWRAVEDADLVVMCTPIAQMRGLVEKALPKFKAGAIVTDVGSVKGTVVHELEPLLAKAGVHFIGSHPMAGAEKMGVSAARPDLFHQAVCVVTPTRRTKTASVKKVEELWTSVGGIPIRLSPELHDDLVSRSSHLPHVVAAELANYILSPVHPREQSLLCATGFRDTTRIASGSPEMWRDICLANRKNLARVLGVFVGDLQELQRALEEADAKVIEEFFRTAKQRRDVWSAQPVTPSPE